MSLLCAALLAFLPQPSLPTGGDDKPTLVLEFGVYPSDKATVMYRKLTPVLEWLQTDLEARLGRPVDVHLTIFKSYEDGLEALVQRKVDFTRFGPASYVLAKRRSPGIGLVAMELEGGDKRFKGIIAVQTSSPLKSLKDLKGKRFAFGDQNSTIGRYLAQAELATAGIHARDLASFKYLGRHDTVARAIEVGDFDAGSIAESTFEEAKAAGKLRALCTFDNVTKPWLAREGLETTTIAALHDSLLSLKDPSVLKELKITGFADASEDDYVLVREGMKRADEFENGIASH